MLKNYRKFLMAGIVTLGLAACGDDVTVIDPIQPPPPSNITSFSVSPSSATIAPHTFVQASANLVTIAGVTGSVSWGSSNDAVATVDGTGRIDAVSEGTAVITATATAGGQTATAAIGVTVRPIQPAQISIQSVTTGMTNTPVNISNVMGQIEINMNFNPGEQLVDSVAVFIGNKRAAKQSFATSPSAGPISLSVNTANYVKNVAAGTAPVDYLNGASTISAAVYPRDGAATATNTIQIVLNNTDGWAADMSKPTQTANSAGGLTYWGGPGAGGVTTLTLYPVIYTPGRTIASTFISPSVGCGSSQFTALPFRATFGAPGSGATFTCTYEWAGGARDNAIAYGAIDNTNNAYPMTPTIANTVVLGSTPDSLRLDWKAPSVSTPSITRTAPAVTGWVHAAWNFINFASADAGVGIRASASRDRAVTYVATNCGGGGAVAMPTGTGADIPECATNFIGGTPGLGSPGTAPYQVSGTESDRLGNKGTSSLTQTFGVDKTLPSIRWGIADATIPAYTAPAGVVVAVDSQFRAAKPVAANDEYRVEYLDDRAGFFNAGAPSGGVSAQAHALSIANHVNNAGACLVGTGPIGATFVTAPACGKVSITAGGTLRVDGWQGGMSVPLPDGEGYYGYSSNVTDAAGNTSGSLFRKAFVSTITPFATGLTVPASISGTVMAFGPTFADSTEVVRQSLQLTYPEALTLPGSASDSLRYSRSTIGTVFDDAITSPFLSSISPNTGAPYVRHLEAVTAAAFPASNVQAAPANTKPVNVVAWSWNPGSILSGGPTPGRSLIVAIPALLVQDGVTFTAFNTGNSTNSVTHFRIIPTVSTSSQFGSIAPLRAQAVSPTNTPNQPFARVDFYRQVTVGLDTWWSYLGSATASIGSDQGTYRSWVYNAPATFVNAWNGTTAQTGVAAGNVIMAVGVTAAGDGLAASATMTP